MESFDGAKRKREFMVPHNSNTWTEKRMISLGAFGNIHCRMLMRLVAHTASWAIMILTLLALASGALATPAVIIQPEQRQVVNTGNSVTFSVEASGGDHLSYQWLHNGISVTGATNSSLTLDNVKYFDQGSYQLRVTDSEGTATSRAGFLNVVVPLSRICVWGTGYTTPIPAGLSDIVAIAAGRAHSLALKADGTVIAWGDNTWGQTTIPSDLRNVVAIAAGSDHNLALKSDGTVVAWGNRVSGQSTVPTGLSDIVAISAGRAHSIALKSDGTVIAWGFNQSHESTVPAGLANVVAISAGHDHNLALKSDGHVTAWGDNFYGQTDLPIELSDVIAIAAGWTHSLALKSDGTIAAWGINGSGQCSVPIGLNDVIAIAAGGAHSLALKSNGTVAAWGTIYNGVTNVPPGLSNVVAIAAWDSFSLALKQFSPPSIVQQPFNKTVNQGQSVTLNVTAYGDELTYQWKKDGADIQGATGSSLTLNYVSSADVGDYSVIVSNELGSIQSNPAKLSLIGPVFPPRPVQSCQVAVAGQDVVFGVAATGSGTLSYQWFHNGFPIASSTDSSLLITRAQYSDRGCYHVKVMDSYGNRVTSIPVFLNIASMATEMGGWGANDSGQTTIPTGMSDVVAIAAGYAHNLALKSDGTVVSWGSQTTVPPGLSDVVAIAAGWDCSLALKSDGTVAAWGSLTSVPAGLSNVVAISAGEVHRLALKSDGTVIAWGSNMDFWSNYAGQSTVPSGLTNVVAISAGGFHNLALKSNGTVVAWGGNNYGQSAVPRGLTDVVAIAAGWTHSLALKSDGTVVAWGYKQYGQSTVPTGLNNVVAISAGRFHSVAVKSDGTATVWGDNSNNQTTIPANLKNMVTIAAGKYHNIALVSQPLFPSVRVHPQSQIIYPNASAVMTINASGGSLNYQWCKNGVTITGATSARYTIAAAGQSDEGDYDVVISNEAGIVTSDAAILTVMPSFDGFQKRYGLTNPDPMSDPKHTGVSQLASYAFGVNPSAPDRSQLPSAALQNGTLQISYPRWKGAVDVGYIVEVSSDLQNWDSGDEHTKEVSVIPIPGDPSREQVIECDLNPYSDTTRRFIRVRITH